MSKYLGPFIPPVIEENFLLTMEEVKLLLKMLSVSQIRLLVSPYNLTEEEAELSYRICETLKEADQRR